MYRGFKITKETLEKALSSKDYYRNLYLEGFSNKQIVRRKLRDFIITDGRIDVSELRSEWFPTEKHDVFLSHSHGDLSDMEALAGYLIEKKGLKVFIDSHIWGYFEELQRELDNKYNKEGNVYNYNGSNWCCNNVTTILNAALQETIDKSEAIFFYNTSNSLTHNYHSSDRTGSPWIFNEIETTRIIRQRKPKRKEILIEKSVGMEQVRNNAEFSYEVNHQHLKEMRFDSLSRWFSYYSSKGETSLDELYNIIGG